MRPTLFLTPSFVPCSLASQVLVHSPPAAQRAHLQPLLLALSPWLSCHSHSARSMAQLVTWALLARFPPDHPTWAHSLGAHLRSRVTGSGQGGCEAWMPEARPVSFPPSPDPLC
jgi:hypothetical protein